MILKIAWRNIWRNKLRSLVVIVSIMLGIWAGIFMMALSFGMNDSRAKSQINSFISDLQIHNNEFKIDYLPKYSIDSLEYVESLLQQNPDVKAYSKRIVIKEAVLNDAHEQGAVSIIGVDPEDEKKVTDIHSLITDGEYFSSTVKSNQILIGEKLAKKLKKEIGNKIVISFLDYDGNITPTKFKIVGIFKTINSMFDEANVYVLNKDIGKLLGSEGKYQEIAINTENKNIAKSVEDAIKPKMPASDKLEYWGEISPDLAYADEMMAQTLYIFMGIIMIALMFGIINTMLMAVLERKHELGMLMAVGMNRKRVFAMIMIETTFLALLGGPLGILLADLAVSYYANVGIDLSAVAEGMNSFGMSSVVYPIIEKSYYLGITVMVIITALISALFPARRALKLNPVDAVRSI